MPEEAKIAAFEARAYTVPTDGPEADGTFAWRDTTLVVAQVQACGITGLGYSYTHACVADLISRTLGPLLVGEDAFDIPARVDMLERHVRNLGRSGLAATAISALDTALWDLKARLLDMPLARLFGMRRDAVPIYGSGGFTTYRDNQLKHQLAGWVEQDGCRFVKMKIGTDPARDPERIRQARTAIGDAELFVDANGAFSPKQALGVAGECVTEGVTWFEEPVTSDDLPGLALVREQAPATIDIAAGEYTYTLDDARRILECGAVDVLQADATRCAGFSGFLAIADLCEAHHTDLSGHCAPALHLPVACAAPRLRNLEWFHDHVRIERELFDGAPVPRNGTIAPDLASPGHGLVFKRKDAERYAA